MDNDKYLNLVTQWQTQGCLKAREKIVLGVVKLIQQQANKYPDRGNRDDLFQEGMLGVLKACDTYDTNNDASFLTYAKQCAIFNIMDYVRRDHVIPKGSETMHNHNLGYHRAPTCHSEIVALAEKRGVPYKTVAKYAMLGSQVSIDTLGDTLGNEDDVFRTVAAMEELEQVGERLNTLSDRDIEILREYAWENKDQSTIADDVGVTRQRIQQIIKSTQMKLRI